MFSSFSFPTGLLTRTDRPPPESETDFIHLKSIQNVKLRYRLFNAGSNDSTSSPKESKKSTADSHSRSLNPLIVFTTGFTCIIERSISFCLALAARTGCDVLTYDVYGHGWSDTPEIKWTHDCLTHMLANLLLELQAINIISAPPYTFMGVSLGGAISLQYSIQHPEQVTRLILISSVGGSDTTHPFVRIARVPYLGPFFINVIVSRLAGPMLQTTIPPNSDEKYKANVALQAEALLKNPGLLRVFHSFVIDFAFTVKKESCKEFVKRNIPVLILWGDKDVHTPIVGAHFLKESFQGDKTELKVYLEETHELIFFREKDIVDDVVAFIKKD